MESFKKSFKSHGSYKHHRKLSSSSSTGGGAHSNLSSSHEEQPILSAAHVSSDEDDHGHHRDVIVDIVNVTNSNNNKDATSHANPNNNIWREPSVEFWNDKSDDSNIIFPDNNNGRSDDPPSKLIGGFLQMQNASGGGDFGLDMDLDLEMDEVRTENRRPSTPVFGSPVNNQTNRSKDLRVSFEQSVLASENSSADSDNPRRRTKRTPSLDNNNNNNSNSNGYNSNITNNNIGHPPSDDDDGIHEDKVVKCTANASFNRRSTLLRAKTRSRLLDPPQEPDRRSGRIPKSGQMRSGLLKGGNNDDEDDDITLFEEDLPENFKKGRLDALTLLQWVSLVVIVAILVATLTIHPLKRKLLWNLQLWKWELMVLVLICGRLVSGWGIKLVVFFIERNFLLRKRVLYFVYGVRKAVQNCLWLGLVLIAWNALFNKKVERETNTKALWYVTKILVCLLIGTLLWLVKTLIIKVLASSFHVSTYFDRIQESIFSQYVIETLSGPPAIEIQKNEDMQEEIADELRTLQNAGANLPSELRAVAFPSRKSVRMKSCKTIGSEGLHRTQAMKNIKFSSVMSKRGGDDQGITIDHLHKLNTNNVSAWSMKRLINIVRHGVLTTLDEQIVNSSTEDESATMIRSEQEAKAAARKIFFNVAKPGVKYIYLEDLKRFMREDEALKTMDQIDGAVESKKISKSCLKNWLVNVFRERRALALTLNDTKTAVNKLHQVVNVVVSIIILIIWLLVLGIATSKFLVFMSSQLLLVAFIFGNTCKTIFEAIVFLFVMHPFDVGDRCEVEGVQMIVEEMNILTTVFLRYDNQKVMYPNSTLATKSIGNFYRSPDMGDSVEFCIHISTPAEKIALMKQKIVSYIESKKDHWQPAPTLILKDFEDLNRVKIALWVSHRMNYQNILEKWTRRALLLEEMVKIFREIGMQYRILPLDINVQNMSPVTSNRLPPSWTGNAS